MNPPSALQGAMGRERKPFTYTPGGLDLSEIKSERMAKRLMRNAMNQGVPDLPPQQTPSPSTPTTPIAVPNFNCLPVQVFPTFNLPANPKSLLRTRSTPDKLREPVTPKLPPPQNVNSVKSSGMEQIRETLSNNSLLFSPANNNNNNNYSFNNSRSSEQNNNIPYSVYDKYNAPPSSNSFERQNYGSEAFTATALPEICYDVEFCQTAPRYNNETEILKSEAQSNNVPGYAIAQEKSSEIIKPNENTKVLASDFTIQPISERISVPIEINEPDPTKSNEEIVGTDDDDQTVKVVKKQIKKKVESEAQNQNGDHNGEAEAEMTVKIPSKKSAAKTETKVEVVKKTLPDGSIEETKTTITKTTVDGKTNITTKTETKIIPKAEEEVEEYEEEEEESGEVLVQEVEENEKAVVVKKEEKTENSETKTRSKEIVEEKKVEKPVEKLEEKQQEQEEEEEEVEEEVEEEEEIKQEAKQEAKQEIKQEVKEEVKQEVKEEVKKEIKPAVQEDEQEEEEEEEEEEVEEVVVKSETTKEKIESVKKEELEPEEETEVEEEEEYEEAEEPEDKPKPKAEPKTETKTVVEPAKETKDEKETDDESEYTEEEIESDKEEPPKQTEVPITASTPATPAPTPAAAPTPAQTADSETPKGEPEKVEPLPEKKEEPKNQSAPQPEQKIPLREPSIPLEKVEDVEIKPIGAASETISKTHTERTEIISSLPDKPSSTLSTQTEYNRIENIVTVNRTTKTLDHSYEQITQQGVPTVKTYFAPGRERVSPTPQPAKPYQPIYTPPHPQPERRHSLLLERLSTERQMPSDIYQKSYQQQYNNQPYEQQRQWSQEPQSEIVTERNVKPSSITNQQWYQQSRKENVIYNNITPSTPAAPSQQWSQPQPQVQVQPQYQTSYTDNILHDSSKISTNTYQQNSYPSYTPAPAAAPTPAPTNWASQNVESNFSNVNTQSNQYSFLNKSSSENYQNTSQQYSSSYVPPPWEQDPNYVAPQLQTQSYYQPQPAANTFSPSTKPGWKPAPPASKFSKPVSNAYIPPAPNQSFVKTASNAPEPQHHPGSKTYYSEYERRYITVPESTYIPVDAKFQPQPDPSPQYYYDNNEPNEPVEHQWRKELREFTEKSQTQTLKQTQTQAPTQVHVSIQQPQQTEFTSVNPPWEEDPKYAKVPSVSYTPTPSWSQTLRPQSWRERSFESEYVGSNEWSKTNSLNRSRPLSTYATSNVEAAPERARGVSVDRYNPNKYQSPLTIPYDSEHGPVQAHTLDPNPAAHRGYHNPNVPAYHARASAEPREQQPSGIPTPRNWGDSRTTPIQSRSFKYLQWITGTED